jgi:hypothetical protein
MLVLRIVSMSLHCLPDQPLNVERGVSGSKTSNIEEEVAGECRVMSRRGKISKEDGGVE